MPSAHRHMTLDAARLAVAEAGFARRPPCRVGVELEWLTVVDGAPHARAGSGALAAAVAGAGTLPGGSAVTFEPGGQLELSSPPWPTVDQTCEAAEADVAAARSAAGGAGLRLVGLGADPLRPPRRVVATPRYEAMEAYFDALGPAGRRMMCNTAAVQVNLGLGPRPDESARRWRVAHAVGPTLAAAFANSPLLERAPSGFRSTRLATWWAMDPGRTRPVGGLGTGPGAWADYALAARVMLVRVDPRRFVPLTSGMTFERWVADGHELGWPTLDDLDYHLGTLFPPVRPRGWLELRMVDALPDPWWRVPVAVAHALLADDEAGEAAVRAAVGNGATGRWVDAARTALAHPGLAASARACFAAAEAGLSRIGAGAPLVDAVAAYAERWVDRGRTPADDRLDAWAEGRAPFPEPEEATSWT